MGLTKEQHTEQKYKFTCTFDSIIYKVSLLVHSVCSKVSILRNAKDSNTSGKCVQVYCNTNFGTSRLAPTGAIINVYQTQCHVFLSVITDIPIGPFWVSLIHCLSWDDSHERPFFSLMLLKNSRGSDFWGLFYQRDGANLWSNQSVLCVICEYHIKPNAYTTGLFATRT